MEPNYFDRYDTPSQQSSPTRPIIRRAGDPLDDATKRGTIAKNNIDIGNAPIDRENKEVNIEQSREGIKSTRIAREVELRKEFQTRPAVVNFETVLPKFAAAIRAADNPVGDMQIITAWVKAYDPTGAIMSQDVQTAEQAQSAIQKFGGNYAAMVDGRGRLKPEVRQNFLREIHTRLGPLADVYRSERAKYLEIAKRTPGVNPANVLGEPFQLQFQDEEAAYLGRPVRNLDGTQGASPPGYQQPKYGDPDTEIKFNDEAGPSGGAELRRILYDALRSGQVRSYEDANALVDQYNQQHRTHFGGVVNGEGFRNALSAAQGGRQFNVEMPHDFEVEKRLNEIRADQGEGGSSALRRGAADGYFVGAADEIRAGATALGGSLRGEGNLGDLYNRNLEAEQAYQRQLQEQNPILYGAGQLGGGLIPGALTFGASTPMGFARLGAGTGAVYGFNSGEDGLENRARSSVIGAGAGAAGGVVIPEFLGLGVAGEALAARNAARNAANRPPVPPLVDPVTGRLNEPLEAVSPGQRVGAANQFGIDLPLGSATDRGGAIIERRLDIRPASAGRMNDARRKVEGQVSDAVENVAGQFGSSRTLNEGGSSLQSGAMSWMARADVVDTKVYDAIPISPTSPANLNATMATLADLSNKIKSNPQLNEELKDKNLVTFLDALNQGGLTWEDTKAFRSFIGDKIGQFRFSQDAREGGYRALYGALSEDMRNTAAAQGPKALRAFERANSFHAAKEARIDGALKQILGNDMNLNAEAAAAKVRAMTFGGKGGADLARLAEIRASTVKGGAWDEIAATLIRMGGQPANSEGRAFDPGVFVKWYADMAEPARKMLFKPELRKSLDQFVAVNQRLANSNALRNTSNTALASPTGTFSVPSAAAAFFTGYPFIAAGILAATGVKAGGELLMAKAWTNPKFVRWATGFSRAAASGNANAVRSRVERLQGLAATNPELREPIESLLSNIANDNITQPLAASQPNKDDQGQ